MLISNEHVKDSLINSELIIALSCAVGTDNTIITELLKNYLQEFGYNAIEVKISKLILEKFIETTQTVRQFQRSKALMDMGNALRKESDDNSILAKGVAYEIQKIRLKASDIEIPIENEIHNDIIPRISPMEKTAFIINSLKHPAEVDKLRQIYPSAFYLFAVYESEEGRLDYLTSEKNIGTDDANILIERDMEETEKYGQHTRDVFELADFHISLNGWIPIVLDKRKNLSKIGKEAKRTAKETIIRPQLSRIIDLIFGNPFITPTFDEFAMFMAYSSSLRSADLSRQVGAVIANKNNEIIATGSNDVPKFTGGQYWPIYNEKTYSYEDENGGRDYTIGYDPNKSEHKKIIDSIIDVFKFPSNEEGMQEMEKVRSRLLNSSIKYLTEYGRIVHAEMAAIIACARSGISTQDATLYCSTFPCHNCARHIIASGIKKVIFVEPYPKSKTLELHKDSTSIEDDDDKVNFISFTGVGPRCFYDLFSLRFSTGYNIERKNSDEKVVKWIKSDARLRCQMQATSYIEKEGYESFKYTKTYNEIEKIVKEHTYE